MMSGPLDFDCDFRRAASHEAVQIDLIVRQAMLEICGRPEGDPSFSFFAEIAVVGPEIIGVAAFSGEALTCLYVVDRFRNSGIGTCLLHNARLSGVRATTIPISNVRVQAFFEHRGWSIRGAIEANIFGVKTRVVALSFGRENSL
jgi:GNAT superfamily N-acetyltransferase